MLSIVRLCIFTAESVLGSGPQSGQSREKLEQPLGVVGPEPKDHMLMLQEPSVPTDPLLSVSDVQTYVAHKQRHRLSEIM